MNNTLIIGLTGGIGSGKSTVSCLFADLGINIIDADIIAREVVEPGTVGLSKIIEHFGQQIIDTDGQLNRRRLRDIIFNNELEKTWLNNCLHPLIRKQTEDQLFNTAGTYAVFVAPLLFENHLEQLCHKVIVVDVEIQTQINRTCDRDNTNSSGVEKIINAQIDRKQRTKKADFIINNDKNLPELVQQVQQIHHQLLSLANFNDS